MSLGIIIVTHTPEMAEGLARLLRHIAKSVPVTFAGGNSMGQIGTSMSQVQLAVNTNEATELLAFYDFGSARRNVELASAFSTKPIHLYDVALVEGAHTAAVGLQAGVDRAGLDKQLLALQVKA
ncbi:PTS sugar transporter subunit IIA domain-containing protein [Loigolactobacillus iwatensis]|uniref:PTS sugar transporter subunit IIA domain-containing protein n=1 Tax=Loigolactobacillus iwatensis TaxID=1267156 RepID=UPI000F7E89E7|nr:PTS mannose family transporter subunit IIA [Loigolactobacillus iwatensis]